MSRTLAIKEQIKEVLTMRSEGEAMWVQRLCACAPTSTSCTRGAARASRAQLSFSRWLQRVQGESRTHCCSSGEKKAEIKRGRFWVRGIVDNAGLYLLRKTVFILAPMWEMFAVLGLEKPAGDESHGDSKILQIARRGHGSLSYKSTWT